MTTKKYNIDQLYAICDHLNAANTIAMGLHISKAHIDLDQLSDITDTIAALAAEQYIANQYIDDQASVEVVDEIYNPETKTFSTTERL